MMHGLPVGYRFQPTDEELVKEYLIKRAIGDELPSPVIKNIDVYTHNPDQLPLDITNDSMRWAYFFTSRECKYGSICSRSTPGGYWKASGRETSIREGKEAIAFKRRLVFYWGRAPDHGTKTEWMMEEFRLNQHPDDDCACVVCKVYTRNSGQTGNRPGTMKRKIDEDMEGMIDDVYL